MRLLKCEKQSTFLNIHTTSPIKKESEPWTLAFWGNLNMGVLESNLCRINVNKAMTEEKLKERSYIKQKRYSGFFTKAC